MKQTSAKNGFSVRSQRKNELVNHEEQAEDEVTASEKESQEDSAVSCGSDASVQGAEDDIHSESSQNDDDSENDGSSDEEGDYSMDDDSTAEESPTHRRKPTIADIQDHPPLDVAKAKPDDAELYRFRILASGVVYLSHIPTGLTKSDIQRFLKEYGGPIDRMKLVVDQQHFESAKLERRKAHHRKYRYLEGWVEFENKKDAKRAAAVLNELPLPGRKSTKYVGAMVGIRYLPGFKWPHLMESFRSEREEQMGRRRAVFEKSKQAAKEWTDNLHYIKTKRKREEREAIPSKGPSSGVTSENGDHRESSKGAHQPGSVEGDKATTFAGTKRIRDDRETASRKKSRASDDNPSRPNMLDSVLQRVFPS